MFEGLWFDELKEVNWAWLHIASEWAIRLGMLLCVPRRRSPSAARAWLLLIFFFPWPRAILCSLIGRAYLPKRRLMRQLHAVKLIRELRNRFLGSAHLARPELAAPLKQAVILMEKLGDFDILGNNQFELLGQYDESIERLIGDIDAAKKHVHLLYYIFADDGTGQRVADALLRAAARGVQCRLLLDAMGSRKALPHLVPRLCGEGIEVVCVLPYRLWNRNRGRRDLRNHRKIAVIDGRIGYVGSQNLIDADFKRGLVYKELVARLAGPVVGQLQAVWLVDRYVETERILPDEGLFPEPDTSGHSATQCLPSDPLYRRANVERTLVALIHGAPPCGHYHSVLRTRRTVGAGDADCGATRRRGVPGRIASP